MWLKELEKQYIPGSTVIWLVGNKGDLAQERQVSVQVQTQEINFLNPNNESMQFWFLYVITQEGQDLANDRGLSFIETSALSGEQVSELLLAVGK